MSRTWNLELGSSFAYDGERCTVVEMSGDAVIVCDSRQRTRRLRLVDVLRPQSEGGKARVPGLTRSEEVETPIGVVWADASDAAREVARERADHVREVLTGYRSGTAEVPRKGEPRASFSADTHLIERQLAKAEELGVGHRTVERWIARYAAMGEGGLIDNRRARAGGVLVGVDARWIATARLILDEQVSESKVIKRVILDRINARLDISGEGDVRRPGRATAYKALDELDAGESTFSGPTKRKRSSANRPDAPYGRLQATRPGEYVLLDTTPLNVFAVVPVTGEWLPAELTVAIDLYSRCILGLRVTPGSTKSIDVSGVLLEAFLPFETDVEWGSDARWPYHGVPRALLIDPAKTRLPRFDRPGIVPETLVVDHGKPFLSEHVTGACARLGISIQPARIYQPTDKAPVERFFRTLDSLLQELPGYKGADIAGRGADVEGEAVYTIPQLEQIIREWTATVYHLRPHSALVDPNLPGVVMSPVQRYEQGIAIAGRLRMPHDRDVILELLPVVRRQFNHYGVEIGKLRYTGPIIAKYRNRSRTLQDRAEGWPFFVNPDDLSRVYFHDPDDGRWHTLTWEHHSALNLPFSLDALEYAKKLALQPGHPADIQKNLSDLLERWGADRALTPSERRIKARAVAVANEAELDTDSIHSLRTVQRLLSKRSTAAESLADELGGQLPTRGDLETQPPTGDDDHEDELDPPGVEGDYYVDAMEQL